VPPGGVWRCAMRFGALQREPSQALLKTIAATR
jgi:hypothetical protein